MPSFLIFIIASFTSQLFKFIIELIKARKLDFRKLVEPGGMPSSHTASFVALSTALWIQHGVKSGVFGISLALTLYIIYEAAGWRRAAGRQAEILNKIAEIVLAQHKMPFERLRELWGHTPLEIIMGILLGFGIGLLALL